MNERVVQDAQHAGARGRRARRATRSRGRRASRRAIALTVKSRRARSSRDRRAELHRRAARPGARRSPCGRWRGRMRSRRRVIVAVPKRSWTISCRSSRSAARRATAIASPSTTRSSSFGDAAEQRVAHGAADDVDAGFARDGLETISAPGASRAGPSPTCSVKRPRLPCIAHDGQEEVAPGCRRRGARSLLVAGGAVFALTRPPEDVSNPDVAFDAEPTVTPSPDGDPGRSRPAESKQVDPLRNFIWGELRLLQGPPPVPARLEAAAAAVQARLELHRAGSCSSSRR